MKDFASCFKQMIIRKKLKIAVVGLGYVGLPLAVEFAKKGFSVLGIDVDKDRIAWISQKKSYITDVPTSDLREIIKNGKFRAESGFSSLKNIDAILICVPTPLKRKNHPNISFIKSAVKGISEHFKKDCLVILESTTYPGTTEEVILPLLEVHGRKHGKDFYLCFSPERIDPGNLKYPVNKIPKVIGGVTLKATRLGALVYGSIVKQVVPVSSPRVAETVKLLENTFRLINIGLIDEMAMMANKMNIDIWEVVDAAKTKPFGFMPFYPGPGVGGHCIPKDPLYLYWKAKKFGFKSSFIKLASGVIRHMPVYVVGRVKEILNQKGVKLNQAKILVIGATYKKDIKDLRQSPPLDIIEILKKEAGSVAYYDPLIPYLQFKDINLKSVDLKSGKLNGFDCAIIATDHTNVDYGMILENSRVIFDSRNVYKGIENKKIHRL